MCIGYDCRPMPTVIAAQHKPYMPRQFWQCCQQSVVLSSYELPGGLSYL